MTSALEKLDAKVAAARKQLDGATAKREAAIALLIRSVDKIKQAQRGLARLEKRRAEARVADKAQRKAAARPRPAEDAAAPLG